MTPRYQDSQDGFEQFFQNQYLSIVTLAFVMIGDRGRAEDVAQEAFIAAHRHWSRLQLYDQPAAWVRRVAINKCRSLGRRQRAEDRAIGRLRANADTGKALDLDEFIVSDGGSAFWSAVRGLPRRQAQCLALRYVEELTVAEISEVLGCSEATVRVHMSRGRHALAEALALEVPSEESSRSEGGLGAGY